MSSPATALPRLIILCTIALLAAVAMGVSGYMLWLGKDAAAGCGGSDLFDCESVLASPWSKWLRLPVSLPGLLLYTLLLTASVTLLLKPQSAELVRRSTLALLAGAILAGGAALWFVGVQFFALPGFCPYCLVVHSCGLTLAGLSVVIGLSSEGLSFGRPLLIGAAGLVALIGGQWLFPPPSIQLQSGDDLLVQGTADKKLKPDPAKPVEKLPLVEEKPLPPPTKSGEVDISFLSESQKEQPKPKEQKPADPVTDKSPKSADEGSKTTETPTETKQNVEVLSAPAAVDGNLELFGGRIKVKLKDVIILGDPLAPNMVVEMFDYTCPHCRGLHWKMEDVRKRYGDQLAIVLLPVPLNAGCNPEVKETQEMHMSSCILARLAIAVWQKRPSQFAAFHDRLMGGTESPEPGQMRFEAGKLMGAEALDKVLLGQTVDAQLKIGTDLYKITKAGKIPKLIFGEAIAMGTFDKTEELFELFETKLGLKPLTAP